MNSVQSMASSSSSTVPSSRGRSRFTSQTEMEMEYAKARHWSQLDYPTTNSESSAESNMKYFALLKEDPQWGRFFTDFESLEVGDRISGGAQADIYEARNTRDGSFDLVVKVMHGDVPLKTFQAQWPMGMLCARSTYKHLFDLPLISILGGTVLRDERFRGRFAFVMYRRWGDLRFLIDRRMKQERSTPGPFPIDQAIHLMSSVAGDMVVLHNNHDIVHRDLKASNVLVWGEFGEDMSPIAILNDVERIGSVVADFECSVGVVGTWYWMAPEVLEQLKAGVPRSEVRLTRASDVYSYGMTCYEIVTGCYPYEGLKVMDTISQILQGRRPELPHDLPEFVRNIIESCWHSNPVERPSFAALRMAMEVKRVPNPMCVVVDNKSASNASIVKVEKWINCQALPLLEVIQVLTDMGLLILKAFDSSSVAVFMRYLEVIDCEGKKVVKDESIANIRKALSLPGSWPRNMPLMYKFEFLPRNRQLMSKCEFLPRNMQLMSKCGFISDSSEMSLDGNARCEVYVVEVIAEWSVALNRILSRLSSLDFEVHSMKCRTYKGRLEYVIYVVGARMCGLLWELRHDMVYPPSPTGHLKIMVQRIADEDISHWEKRMQNLNLIRPCNSSNSSVHLEMESWKGVRSTKVILRHEKGVSVDGVSMAKVFRHIVSKYDEVFKDYPIVGASIKYPVLYRFLNKGQKIEDIDVKPLDKDGSDKISRILGAAAKCGCFGDNMELIISGSKEMVYDILKRLFKNGLIVNGGEVYCESGTRLSYPSRDLVYFII